MAPRRRAITSFLVAALLVIPAAAFGNTYYVAATGSSDSNPGSAAQPWATIQKAVDTIANGDTIVVKPGTYIGCRIRSSGASGAVKTLKAETAGTVTLNAKGTLTHRNSIIEIQSDDFGTSPVDYWTIDGFVVINSQRYGVDPINASHLTVRNCTVHNSAVTGINSSKGDYVLIENNTSYSNSEHGIYVNNSADYGTLRGNTLYSNVGLGIHMNGDIAIQPGDGIMSGWLLEKNIAHHNVNGYDADGVETTVWKNNLAYANTSKGLQMTGGDGTQNGAVTSRNNKIYNNTFVCPAAGFYPLNITGVNGAGVPPPVGNKVLNNIFYTYATGSIRGSIDVSSAALTGFVSDYNVVMGLFGIDDTSVMKTLAQWQGMGYDTHSVYLAQGTDTTLFANAASSDFHLKAGSPAIDAGTNLTAEGVTDDIEGRTRPVNGVFDIGCYEYSGLPMVATPVFAPPAGAYSPSVDVTITTATGTATLYYTTDGSDPTQLSTQYTGTPVHIAATTTLKARAFAPAMDPSSIASGAYTIGGLQTTVTFQQGASGYAGWEDTWLNGDTDTPGTQPDTNYSTEEIWHLQYNTPDRQVHRFNISSIPAGMKIDSATLRLRIVEDQTPTGAATVAAYRVIRHWIESQATFNKATSSVSWGTPGLLAGTDYDATVLGTSPAVTTITWFDVDITGAVDAWYKGTAVNEGVMLKTAANGHLKTYSSKSGMTAYRPQAVIVYESAIQKVETPTFSPPPGSFVGSADVALSCATGGAEIRYTTNGVDPDASSTLYAAPIHVTVTTTIKARAFKSGMTPSDVATGTYDISGTVATPTFSPLPGLYNVDLDVTILCATFDAEIHYTTNGDTPTSGSMLYSGPVRITTSTTFKAIAVKSGAIDSGIAQGFYQLEKQKPVTSDLSTIPTKVKAGVDLSIAVYAQATDVGTGDLNVVDAECFIGSAPAPGGGTHMNAADGAFDSSTESLVCPALSTAAYTTPGSIQVHARAKDAAGNWSDVATVILQVVTAIPPGQVTDLTVSPQDAYETLPLTLVSVSGSEAAGFPTAGLVDGNTQSYWRSLGSASADEQSIVVDLGEVKEIAAVALVAAPKSGPFPRKFTIAASEDATTWTTVAQAIDLKAAAKTRYIWQFQPMDARYIRVYGTPVWNSKERLWYWQIGEIEVPLHFGSTAAVLEWTAPADDGYSGPRAAAYDVRYSNASISASNFDSRPVLGGVGDPIDPGQHETVNADVGDTVGRIFAALKTRDSEYNWSLMSNVASGIVGGARLRSLAPSEAALLAPAAPPVFTFGTGSIVKSVSASVSSSPGFPPKPVRRLTGEMDSTARFAMKSGSTLWRLSASQWKSIKKAVLGNGIVHWRMEGKTTINKAPAVLFGPIRSAYFEMGSITGLTVGPSPHTFDGKDALYPTLVAPLLSWVNNAPNAVKFFIDLSTDANVPVGDKLLTVTLGGKGVAATSYQLTASDWKKVRQLATKGDGALYWRVRGTDKDGLLGCGSAIKPLVVDGGNWFVSSLGNLSATPAAITWTNDADGLVKCGLQFSVDDQFEKLASMTVKVPSSAVAYATGYTLTASDVTKLTNLALKKGLDKLYYRVYAEDAEKAFVARSTSQIVNVP